MIVYLLAFLVLALVMTGMAVGVIFSNKPIKGSCGGMANLGIKDTCEICGGVPEKCEDEQKRVAAEKDGVAGNPDLAYDATNSKASLKG